MPDDPSIRYRGENLPAPASHVSPYPTSRLSPVHDLVDVAREIANADAMIGAVLHGKLEVIAEQIRALQQQAREILARAEHDAALHRAECRFRKRAGHVYHLYRRPDGGAYLSLLSPAEWGTPPHEHVGSWELLADSSWRRT
jgi:hypothetical protein